MKYIYLFLSIVYAFSFYLWSPLIDGFYWMNRCSFYQSEFLNVFSLWLGSRWLGINDNIVFFRCLGLLLGLFSIVIPFLSLQKPKDYKDNIYLLTLGILLMGPGTFQIYNPDSTTLFFSVLIVVFLLRFSFDYLSQGVFLGFLSAFLVSSRFPNILAVGAIPIYIYCKCLNKKKVAGCIIAYFLSCLLFYYAIVVLITRRFDIVNFAMTEIGNISYSIGDSHNITSLLQIYFNQTFVNLTNVLSFLGAIFTLYIINIISKNENSPLLYYSLFTVFFLWTLYAFHSRLLWMQTYSLTIIALTIYWTLKSHSKIVFLNTVTIILIGGIACAGSDQGYIKLFPYMACFMPVVLINYKEYFCHLRIKIGLFSIVLLSIITFNYKIKGFTSWYNWGRITTFLSPEDYSHYKDLVNEYNELPLTSRTIFYGYPYSHFMYSATNTIPPYAPTFWMSLKNEREILKIIKLVQDEYDSKIIDYSKNQLLQEEALSIGMKKLETNNSNVYFAY